MKKSMRYIIGFMVCAVVLIICNCQLYAKDSAGDVVVIVDAGHGGRDVGASSSYDNESILNWNIALALKAELETYNGVKVYLTRGSAEWNTNAGRGRQGLMYGADLVVSVHNNSGGDGSASGVSVYGTNNGKFKAQVKPLCENICKKISALGLPNLGYHTRQSTKDPSRDYYTLLDEASKCNIPSLIIEHCYLNNASDAAFIHNSDNQSKCGTADATAIAEYFGLTKRGSSSGSSITLLRTYSTHMISSGSGNYTSSNTAVAVVDNNGLVTATGAGTATITCTMPDKTESITVNVPDVKMIGIAAGSNPTFYDASAIASYDKNRVIIKAIYSDGHVEQISPSKAAFGALPSPVDGAYDIPISYNGFSCSLRLYGTGAAGNYQLSNNDVIGTNSDILVIPSIYNGINTGVKIVAADNNQTVIAEPANPAETVTKAPAEIPTQGQTKPEPETETETQTEAETEMETETETETEMETEPETETVNDETEKETTAEISDKDADKKQNPATIIMLVIGGVLITAGAVICIVKLNGKKKSK